MGFNGDLYATGGASVVMTTKGDMVDYDSERQRLGIGSTNQVLTVTAGLPAWEDAGHVKQTRALEVACGDETTAITVADNLIKFRMPFAMTLATGEDGVRASLSTAGTTSGVTTMDIWVEMYYRQMSPPEIKDKIRFLVSAYIQFLEEETEKDLHKMSAHKRRKLR